MSWSQQSNAFDRSKNKEQLSNSLVFEQFDIKVCSLKKLNNHSDTMQLTVSKNLGGMSLGQLLDFSLKFSMKRWISYASVGVGNNEFFEFYA